MSSPQERRRHPRVPIRVPATLTPAADGPVELWQLSQEGLFLRMERSPKVLDGLKVTATLKEGRLEAWVQVRSFLPKGSFPQHPEVSGAGCQITQLSPEGRRIVNAYLVRIRDVYQQLQFQLAIGKKPDPALVKDACLELLKEPEQLKDAVVRMVKTLNARRP